MVVRADNETVTPAASGSQSEVGWSALATRFGGMSRNRPLGLAPLTFGVPKTYRFVWFDELAKTSAFSTPGSEALRAAGSSTSNQ